MAPALLLIILFALAWVVLILPKQREMKRHNELVASLRVGERVMTGSGFYGTLTEVEDDTVKLLLAPGLEVTVARRAVASRVEDPAPSPTDPSGASAGTGASLGADDEEPVVDDPTPARSDDEHEADR